MKKTSNRPRTSAKMPKLSNNIQARLTVIFVTLAVAPLLVVGLVLGVYSYSVQLQQVLNLQEQQAQRIAIAVEAYIQGIETEMRVVADVHSVMDMPSAQQELTLRGLLAHNSAFEDIILLDEAGNEKIHFSRKEIYSREELGNRSEADEFQVPKEQNVSYYSPLQTDPMTNEPFMIIAVPMSDPFTEKVIGVLVAEVRTKPIWTLIADFDAEADDGESVYIVDDAQHVVAHRDPSIVLGGNTFTILTQKGIQRGLNSDKRVVLAAESLELGGQKLYIVAEKDFFKALNLAITTLGLIVGLSVIAAATAGISGNFAVSRIVHPIKELAVTSQAIARGDLNQTIGHRADDEVGQLADAFRQMMAYLQTMAAAADNLALGDMSAQITPQSEQDALGNAFQRMLGYQKTMSIAADRLALGDITAQVTPQSEQDALGNAFQRMIGYQQAMAAAADRLALGDVGVQVTPQSEQDALGNAFRRMIGYQQAMAAAADHLAVGDVSVQVTPQSEQDALGKAFRRMVGYQQAMAAAADHLALGDITAQVTPQSGEDVLGNAFQRMIDYQKVMAAAADRLALGDMSVQVVPQSERDALGNAFAQMVASLRELIGSVTQGSETLGAAAEQMAITANQVALAVGQVAIAVGEMAKGTNQQIVSVSQTVNFIIQMSEAIEGVAKGAQEQSVAVNNSSEITQQMSLAINKVTASALASMGDSTQATELSRVGAERVAKTIEGMENIKSKVGLSAQRVEEMGEHSEQIGVIVETINEIAAQTNLLSLNAAIEAARAGEHGKGFAVVADEVRRLAAKSTEATKEITALVRSVQKTVTQTVQAMNEGVTEVTMGVNLANEAGQAMRNALLATEKVNHQMEEISIAAQHMTSLAGGLVGAMDTVSAVVEENTAATEEMAANSDEMASMSKNIASISEENSAASEQIASTVEEVSAQVEEVAAAVQSVNHMAKALQDQVARFILPG